MTVQAFTESNGHANPYAKVFDLTRTWSVDDVKQARRRVAVAVSAHRLKLLESLQCGDLATLAYDRLDRMRDGWHSIGGGRQARRAGRNYPFVNTEIDLEHFRDQSRILWVSNSYANGLVEGVTSYTLGDGMVYRFVSKHKEEPAPKELLAKLQDILDAHHKRNQWHGGEQPGIEEELVGRSMVDGEWFLDHVADSEGNTDLRIIEPEHVTKPLAAGDEYWGGILTPKGDVAGPRKFYNTRWQDTEEDVEISAERIIHYRRNVVRNVKRGMPDFTYDTLQALHLAARLRENMTLGAAMQASYAGIRQHDSATQGQVEDMVGAAADYTRVNPNNDNTEYIKKLETGMVDIPKGMNFVNPPTAQNAAAHVEILLACLRGAGRRWMAPDWVVAGDASNNNLASSLVANDPFVIKIKRNQRDNEEVNKKSAWLAVKNKVEKLGRITVRVKKEGMKSEQTFDWKTIDGLVDIQVEAPSPESRNKLEEAQVNQIYSMLRAKSTQTIQQEQGLEPEEEQVNFDKAQEQGGPQGGGLPLPGDPGQQQAPQQPEPPQLPGMESIQEAAGTCKPGERADLTGCAPATTDSSQGGDSSQAITVMPAKKKYGKSKAKLEILGSPAALENVASKVLGGKDKLDTLSSLVGAPDDAEVRVIPNTKGNSLVVQTIHKDYNSARIIKRVKGKLVIKNEEFWMNENAQGKGLGTEIFGRQIEQAQEMGVAYIECHAAQKNADGKKQHNGYYTWPRLGYDQSIESFEEDNPNHPLVFQMEKHFPNAKSISDIMATSQGRDWWKKNGIDLYQAKFDLSPGSRSLQIFEAYQSERAARPAREWIEYLESLPHEKKVENFDLSDDEEAALDRAWVRIEKAWAKKADAQLPDANEEHGKQVPEVRLLSLAKAYWQEQVKA